MSDIGIVHGYRSVESTIKTTTLTTLKHIPSVTHSRKTIISFKWMDDCEVEGLRSGALEPAVPTFLGIPRLKNFTVLFVLAGKQQLR